VLQRIFIHLGEGEEDGVLGRIDLALDAGEGGHGDGGLTEGNEHAEAASKGDAATLADTKEAGDEDPQEGKLAQSAFGGSFIESPALGGGEELAVEIGGLSWKFEFEVVGIEVGIEVCVHA